MNIDNPFIRWHKSFEDYPSFLSDIDDYAMHTTDDFERLKKYKADKKHVVGITTAIPKQDNDEAFEFYDIQGESLYSNPPPKGYITVDHGLDEEHIWAFGRDLFNQEVVKNTWMNENYLSGKHSYAPWWGEKLCMPHFYKQDKLEKFDRHWDHRLGLETLKKLHVLRFGRNPSEHARKAMQDEINWYIS